LQCLKEKALKLNVSSDGVLSNIKKAVPLYAMEALGGEEV
jgi:hypothetical protein